MFFGATHRLLLLITVVGIAIFKSCIFITATAVFRTSGRRYSRILRFSGINLLCKKFVQLLTITYLTRPIQKWRHSVISLTNGQANVHPLMSTHAAAPAHLLLLPSATSSEATLITNSACGSQR